jgi:hypothetical protein
MVEIHIFDKRLDASSLLDFILAHSFGNFSGVSFNTGNQGVREFSFLGTFIGGFNNNSFLTGLSPVQHNDHSSVL